MRSAQAGAAGASLVVTPELSLCGYPPEDLVLRPGVSRRLRCASFAALAAQVRRHTAIVGFPERTQRPAATTRWRCIRDGRVATGLPQAVPAELHGVRRGALFRARRTSPACSTSTACACARRHLRGRAGSPDRRAARRRPARRFVVVPNGSPYHTRQQALRREQVVARGRARTALPIVYVNRVGGQDELVFDGASFVVDADGTVVQQLPAWHETVALVDIRRRRCRSRVRGGLDDALEAHVYQALVMGVRDYVDKNGFPGVLLGLSGGIDSALTLAVAVDALGATACAR